jgi:4-hydroxybenzoate polyprenyltransferase
MSAGKNMDFSKFSKLIMIEQTLFALPFALTGVLFAGGGTFSTWVLVIIALTAARTAGMSFNRVIDAKVDAKNPRTMDRLIPSGKMTSLSVWIIAIASSLILIAASKMLNDLCYRLSFVAVGLLFTYPYFKRFSSSSHFYLGLVEAAAPIGGYLAVTGEFSIIPFLLGFVILFWIAGLDVVYAIQDMEFDIKENLHSIPARLGKKNALAISSVSYCLSIGMLFWAGLITDRSIFFWTGVIMVGCIFLYQQKLARDEDAVGSIKQFFKVNMYVSVILFFSTGLDMVFDRYF